MKQNSEFVQIDRDHLIWQIALYHADDYLLVKYDKEH